MRAEPKRGGGEGAKESRQSQAPAGRAGRGAVKELMEEEPAEGGERCGPAKRCTMREDVQELGLGQIERQPPAPAEGRWVELQGIGGKGVGRGMD